MRGNVHLATPAVIGSGRAVVAAAVVAVVVMGLAAVTSGCESCQPSSRYHQREFEHELKTQLCAPGSFYRECGPGAADPVPGARPIWATRAAGTSRCS